MFNEFCQKKNHTKGVGFESISPDLDTKRDLHKTVIKTGAARFSSLTRSPKRVIKTNILSQSVDLAEHLKPPPRGLQPLLSGQGSPTQKTIEGNQLEKVSRLFAHQTPISDFIRQNYEVLMLSKKYDEGQSQFPEIKSGVYQAKSPTSSSQNIYNVKSQEFGAFIKDKASVRRDSRDALKSLVTSSL